MRRRDVIMPASILSPTQRTALAECGKTGGLYKRDGVWRGSSLGPAINGNTIANLARDGLLTIEKNGLVGSATLTEKGDWFSRALLGRADGFTE